MAQLVSTSTSQSGRRHSRSASMRAAVSAPPITSVPYRGRDEGELHRRAGRSATLPVGRWSPLPDGDQQVLAGPEQRPVDGVDGRVDRGGVGVGAGHGVEPAVVTARR